MDKAQQREQIINGKGMIAALDQSGGSTPKALAEYGVQASDYANEDEMFAMIHDMRRRIMTAPAFSGDKVLGAILFERTMDGSVEGMPVPQYLSEKRGVVPFLKVDKGLEEIQDGAQILKPMPELDALCARAVEAGIFGTKMRSVIHENNAAGIAAVVNQQCKTARQILAHGLVPIVEPEINIKAPDKADCEATLKAALLTGLNHLNEGQEVILKLTLPEKANFYRELVEHPRVLRVVALSGGYSREESNRRLAANAGIIASFSRALTEGLKHQMSDADFNATIANTIEATVAASAT